MKSKPSDHIKSILKYVFAITVALSFLLPFAIMILGAFNDIQYASFDPLFWIPKEFSLANFKRIFGRQEYLTWVKNSVITTVIPVFTQMFFAAILGYIFGKKQFWGREFIFWMFMAVIMIPQQLLIIPKYIMFARLGWINTYLALIVPELWGVMGVFLVRQFLQSVPDDLEEAARIDGANDFQIFSRVIMPLTMPVVATVGTFTFVARWNDLFQPLIYTTQSSMFTLTVGLASMLSQEGHFGMEMAGSLISFLPSFIIFIFFQRYFTEGIQMSGIK